MIKKLITTVFILVLIGAASTKATAQYDYYGDVKLFAGNFAPKNWMICEGQLLYIYQYETLYSVIGNTYGGDGKSTFALPDLRGRVPVGDGNGPGLSPVSVGQISGAETATIVANQLPSHKHDLKDVTEINIYTAPVELNKTKETIKVLSPSATGTTTVTTTDGGYTYPINIRHPSLGLTYIICVNGMYPARE